jgi:hypothetical protein
MKVVLSLEAGLIPPSIGIKTLNPAIDFEKANVEVVRELIPWPKERLRRASINSFGFGGANGHCIIDHVSNVLPGYVKPGVVRHIQAVHMPNGQGHISNGVSHQSNGHSSNGISHQSNGHSSNGISHQSNGHSSNGISHQSNGHSSNGISHQANGHSSNGVSIKSNGHSNGVISRELKDGEEALRHRPI